LIRMDDAEVAAVIKYKADQICVQKGQVNEKDMFPENKEEISLMQYLVIINDIQNFSLIIENTFCNLG